MNTPSGSRRLEQHFPGPNGEMLPLLAQLISEVVQRNSNWRESLHPDDPSIGWTVAATPPAALQGAAEQLSTKLQGTYPFHSPRYVAHQQNEVLLASTLGVVAGTLYNPNNITVLSAPATVDLEIDACSDVLTMLGGYTLPPEPRDAVDGQPARANFAWTHLTSGGTTANIEALWVARAVAYLPLLIQQMVLNSGDTVLFEDLGDEGRRSDLSMRSAARALCMSPSEALMLLDRLAESIAHRLAAKFGAPVGEDAVRDEMRRLLGDPIVNARGGFSAVAAQHPPVVFASSTAHYSVKKAADILGFGRSNLVSVHTDAAFRMDVDDLRAKIQWALEAGKNVVAVICVAGSTEEGSIDPLDDVLALRTEFENGPHGASFWVHVDGAWGGYLASALREAPTGAPATAVRAAALAVEGQLPRPWDSTTWLGDFTLTGHDQPVTHHLVNRVQDPSTDSRDVAQALYALVERMGFPRPSADASELVRDQLTDDLLDMPESVSRPPIAANVEPLARLIGAFGGSDSITVDPHKLGHTAYPAGLIAFAEDRVRDLIAQDAPYVTRTDGRVIEARTPLRTAQGTKSPATWTLEGSRPGAAACSVWLAARTLPLHRDGHGQVMLRSLQAARYFHALLVDASWWPLLQAGQSDVEIIPLVESGPDTNIVMFAVRHADRTDAFSLGDMNRLTEQIGKAFVIDAEQNDRRPMSDVTHYVSGHTIRLEHYSTASIEPFLRRAGADPTDYPEHGVHAMRAVLANPYLWDLADQGHDVLRELVASIVERARELAPVFQ